MNKDISLFNGNCLEVMQDISDKSIDAIMTDLPYGITACKNWDEIIPVEPLWMQYKRIIKDHGVIILTAVQPFASLLITSNLDWFRYDWIWEKTNATGHMSAQKRPLRAHEHILVFSKEQTTYNPQKWQIDEKLRTKRKTLSWTESEGVYGKEGKFRKLDDGSRFPRSVIKISNHNARKCFHPTQKPVSLFEYLVKTYSNENDVILDSCMGSGTTGIACANLNRKFIGIELEKQYFEIAQERIMQAYQEKKNG